MKQLNESLPRSFKALLLLSLLTALFRPRAGDAQGAPPGLNGLIFVVGSSNAAPGGFLVVPISVYGFSNIGTLQFSFHFDPAKATFVDVEQFTLPGLATGNFGTIEAASGSLRVSWDDLGGAGQSLADGTTLFGVKLLMIGTIIGNVSSVRIDGTPLSVE